ncbi:NmrA family NAD(P)-binding protein [Hymenobacter metallilatus]|uniref:NAD-dependent epimerase/dehydratase family protein n=1 Tax=Hymenobacter metallilatus TaxID=2493666 RepID=A0A3R9LY38_9BACT|nr:NAD(P)H-binding protein [Hymenobacter metallilatus]RSK31057.1 NAD-dependent epimerase/dehydratase family protein [Hymenobacter metallilatus]
MAKHIVVTGATGNIGTVLVHTLLQQGHRVTAVARPSSRLDALAQAGATTRAGNLHDVAFLTETLHGADAAFLMIPPNVTAPDVLEHMRQTGEAIAEAVRASGLRQAVHLSSIGADLPAGTGPVVGVHHQEARLNAIAGLSVLHLRPAYFMENLLANIGLIQHMGIAGSAMRADLRFPLIATRDIAARAAEALQAGISGQSSQLLLGARNHTMQEVTAALGAAIGRPGLAYVQFPYDDAKKGMMQAGLSESMASLYDEMTRNMNEEKVMVNDVRTPEATTPTTIEEFARTVFAPAFQGAAAAQPA